MITPDGEVHLNVAERLYILSVLNDAVFMAADFTSDLATPEVDRFYDGVARARALLANGYVAEAVSA